jgi:hypothetical protein
MWRPIALKMSQGGTVSGGLARLMPSRSKTLIFWEPVAVVSSMWVILLPNPVSRPGTRILSILNVRSLIGCLCSIVMIVSLLFSIVVLLVVVLLVLLLEYGHCRCRFHHPGPYCLFGTVCSGLPIMPIRHPAQDVFGNPNDMVSQTEPLSDTHVWGG